MSLKEINLCFIGNMLGRNAKYAPSQGQIIADLFASEGYNVSCVSSKINRLARLVDIIQALIKNFKTFDIVLHDTFSGLSFVTAVVTVLLCKIFKLPIIMVLHGGNLPEFIKKYPRSTKKVLGHADVLVAPSRFLAEKIGELGFKVYVIPNVIDLSQYPYCERKEIKPKLIWMRSFHPIYNPEMAIDVLDHLREHYPAASLIMAGVDKGLEIEVKKKVEEMGLSDAVRFAGFLDLEKKIREFSCADIYLNTNRIDNMPVSVLEARALGLPVVATNVGGLSYLIKHGEDGFLVETDDVRGMVESIRSLLENPGLTQKISRNGRSLAERSSWKLVCLDWEELFSKLLKKKPSEKKIAPVVIEGLTSKESEN